MNRNHSTVVALLVVAACTSLCAQTLMPLPPFASTFSSTTTRGYWFQAPTNFTITGLRVPDETSAGIQNVEVFILTAPPPVYSASASGGSVFYANNQPSSMILPVNIPVTTGQYVGILGACGTTTMRNSYGAGLFSSSIGGFPVTLTRMLTQFNLFTAPAPNYSTETGGSIARVEMYYVTGPTCAITTPVAAATVSANVDITFDATAPMSAPISAGIEYSTDAGVTYSPCTPVTGPNPILGIATPATGIAFQWDSLTDMVGRISIQPTILRITVNDGSTNGFCTVAVDVDNVAPVPTCALVLTSSTPVREDAAFDLTPDSLNSPTVDALIEFSTDAGATFSGATLRSSTNPLVGLAVATPVSFDWDTRTDGVGIAAIATGVIVRATISDGVSLVDGECSTAPFDIDNTAICFMICGDCNLDTVGPAIVDALVAAQISAGLAIPTFLQTGCCDVNSSSNIDIIDSLQMAQASAGLPVTLTCP